MESSQRNRNPPAVKTSPGESQPKETNQAQHTKLKYQAELGNPNPGHHKTQEDKHPRKIFFEETIIGPQDVA